MNRSRQIVTKTEAVASHGMVTAMHPLAAEAGIEILEAGGSAADAAIATALAIGVVEPFMSGLGACAYAVAYDASSKQTTCYDGSAVAPREARADMFELVGDAKSPGLYGWRATVGDVAETGYRSPTVPGALAAFKRLHDAAGLKPWRELFAPAIRLASDGYDVDEYFFAQSAASTARLQRFTDTMEIFFRPDGTPWVPTFDTSGRGHLRQTQLAETLGIVADEGPDVFYQGRLAKSIVEFLRQHDGLLTSDDFASYEARTLEPLVVPYRDHRIACLPENSGGPTVAFALKLLEGFDLQGGDFDSVKRLHLVAEALRMAYSDRFRFLGDPRSVPVPLEGLLHERYVDQRRALIDVDGCRLDPFVEGDPWPFDSATPASTTGSGDSTDQHTTHLNVVDKDRNMVALTATLGARFGSGVTVADLGVVLNNGLMWWDPEPGHTNSIAPGKRALHAAAPSLLFNLDGPLAAVGSPGARKIMSSVLQVLLNLVDHGMGIQEAIAAPRIHREAAPGVVVDSHYPASVAEALTARGYDVTRASESFMSSYFGRPTGILVDRKSSRLHGGVEPHRTAAAIGY